MSVIYVLNEWHLHSRWLAIGVSSYIQIDRFFIPVQWKKVDLMRQRLAQLFAEGHSRLLVPSALTFGLLGPVFGIDLESWHLSTFSTETQTTSL